MNASHTLSDRRKTVYASLLVAGTCMVLVLLAEGLIRLRALIKYGYVWGVESTFEYDSDIDLRLLKAGTEFGPIQINSLGFRGPEITSKKPDGRVRIAFLGGSTTFCAEVSGNESTWPHLVWQAVRNANATTEFDYVNGGVPGYGINSTLKNLEHRIAKLDPDVIVIYHATNDLSANTLAAARERGLAKQRPAKQKLWLSNYSLLVHLVEVNLKIKRNQRKNEEPSDTLQVDPLLLTRPFREDLTNLVIASKSASKLVALITFATQMRPEQTPEQRAAASKSSLYYMPYMSPDGLIDSFALYNDVIREVAAEQGAVLIDAEYSVPGDDLHFHDSVHFSDAGSRLMAAKVADVLQESDEFVELVNDSSATETNSTHDL